MTGMSSAFVAASRPLASCAPLPSCSGLRSLPLRERAAPTGPSVSAPPPPPPAAAEDEVEEAGLGLAGAGAVDELEPRDLKPAFALESQVDARLPLVGGLVIRRDEDSEALAGGGSVRCRWERLRAASREGR